MVATAVDLEDTQCSPRVHGRVDVIERPLVGGELTVGMHVPLTAQQQQLVLGELGVDHGEGHAVEGEVPRGEPRVLPLVGHRDHVGVVQMAPLVVAAVSTGLGRRRQRRIAVEPALDIEVEELLRPQHPGERLAQHGGFVGAGSRRGQVGVELVGLALAGRQGLVPAGVHAATVGRQAQAQLRGRARRHRHPVPQRSLRPGALGVDAGVAVHHVIADAVLRVGRAVDVPESPGVRVVVAEQAVVGLVAGEDDSAQGMVLGDEGAVLVGDHRPAIVVPPRPCVAEPHRRQDVQRRRRPGRCCGCAAGRRCRRASPWRSRGSGPSSGRPGCRCRAARTPRRGGRGGGSRRRGGRRGTRAAGRGSDQRIQECVGVESRYHHSSLASSPWLPSVPVRPKIRSLRIGSAPFHSANPKHSSCCVSHTAPRPSSLQR